MLLIGIVALGATVARVNYQPTNPPPPAVSIPNRFPQTNAAMRTPGRLRVLFIGNSLTDYNGGLALMMQQLAASGHQRPVPIFDQVTMWGATWAQLWDVTKSLPMIRQGGWDYVVLQDYSTAPMIYRAEMDVYARRFSREVKNVGARPVFFMTWPHDDQLPLQTRIGRAYISVALDNQGLVAPVGYAWQKVEKLSPGFQLYDPRDKPKKHPNQAGSYLTACVFYSLFFNQSPHGLTGRIVEGTNVFINLPPAVATLLQDAAWATVQEMGPLATTKPTTAPVANDLAQ